MKTKLIIRCLLGFAFAAVGLSAQVEDNAEEMVIESTPMVEAEAPLLQVIRIPYEEHFTALLLLRNDLMGGWEFARDDTEEFNFLKSRFFNIRDISPFNLSQMLHSLLIGVTLVKDTETYVETRVYRLYHKRQYYTPQHRTEDYNRYSNEEDFHPVRRSNRRRSY